MRSKASTLCYPTLKYIYKLLVQTLNGRGDSMGVVIDKDLFYLYSIRKSPYAFRESFSLVYMEPSKEIEDKSDHY